MMVLFGAASGPAPAVDPNVLNKKGCLYLTRPSIMAYNKARPELAACAAALFAVVTSGKLKIEVNQAYPISETAPAHTAPEARNTTGPTVTLQTQPDHGTANTQQDRNAPHTDQP